MKIKSRFSDKQKNSLYKIIEFFPDTFVIRFFYFIATGKMVNLKKPTNFTEKIQHYKLNYRNDLMPICADKFKMREYMEEKGLSDHLPELYQVVDDYDQIDFQKLPSSLVIKLNNGTGTNLLIKDSSKTDHKKNLEETKLWDVVNTLAVGREWAYKNIERKIIVEEYLKPSDDFQIQNGISDYKIMCFNGNPEIIWVDIGRHSQFERAFYDTKWTRLNVKSNRKSYQDSIDKPIELKKMLKIAKELSEDFPFVRVDLYYLNDKIYIGEMTFYPWSGYVKLHPNDFDKQMGAMFNIDY